MRKKSIRYNYNSNNKAKSSNNTRPNTNDEPSSIAGPDENTNGIYIQNLQEFHITNAKEGLSLLQKGLKHRQVASTKMNDFSSRSHTIFTITLYKEHKDNLFRLSKMNLVDLAGSENINRSGAMNQRAKETGSINQSLLTLGRVINSLADKSPHVPFRESKLTRLLQDSLGGNTKTALIATISPAKVTSEETCSTLEYASKAKNIKNKPQLGSVILKDILLKNITSELAKVKSDLMSTKSKDGIYMSHEHYQELIMELESSKTEVQESKRMIEKLSSQNSMLLKDKRSANEVNELQRIKLNNLKDSMSNLNEKLEIQNGKETKLMEQIGQLEKSREKLNSLVKNYQTKQSQLKTQISNILNENLFELKKILNSHKDAIRQSEGNFDVEMNLKVIKDEITSMLEKTQHKTEMMYKEFIEEFLEQTPINLQKIFEHVTHCLLYTSRCV